MVLSSPENVLRLAGTLISGPTNLALDFPYGGTPLGVVSSGRFVFGVTSTEIKVEEYNSSVFDILQSPETAALVAVLRSFDPDALGLVFPVTETGAVTGDAYVDAKNEGFPYRPTTKETDAEGPIVLLFAPKEPSHPFIVIYNAIPMVKAASEIALNAGTDMQVGVAFRALPDANSRLYQWGMKEDITIT